MSLNFDGIGEPIAYINGGERDGEIIFLNKEEDNSDSDSESEEEPKYVGRKRISIKKGRMVHLPSQNRFVRYIVGKSGSGKSTLAAEVIEFYHKLFPKNDIYLLSLKDHDIAFESLEKRGIMVRIKLDDRLLELDPKELVDVSSNSLFIFDDVDAMADINVNLMRKINAIRKYIMEVGRSQNVSLIICSHDVNHISVNRDFSRKIMNELTELCFFNKSCNRHQLPYCLKTYFQLKPDRIENLIEHNTRWTSISSNHPQYILRQKDCVMNC